MRQPSALLVIDLERGFLDQSSPLCIRQACLLYNLTLPTIYSV